MTTENINYWDDLMNSTETLPTDEIEKDSNGNLLYFDKSKRIPKYIEKTFAQVYNEYNESINNALSQIVSKPYPILGRDEEVRDIVFKINRIETPVALLLGEAGVGKTTVMQEMVRQFNNGEVENEQNLIYIPVELRLGPFSALGGVSNSLLQSKLSTLFNDIKKLENHAQGVLEQENIRFVLFIDEVHMIVTIFGEGTKIGGDVLKDLLARPPIKIVAATTKKEYDSSIATDEPFAQRFKIVQMRELPKDIVLDIAHKWWDSKSETLRKLRPSDAVFERTIQANAIYRSDRAEPRKTLDILEDYASYSLLTGKVVDEDTMYDIFDSININLNFKLDAVETFDTIKKRVIGQEMALFELRRAIQSLTFQLYPDSDLPMLTALMLGPTGVGKTETAKALAEGVYEDDKAMFIMNMPDYNTPQHVDFFRKNLGEHVRHTPYSLIVFDEYDKCDPTVLDAMLGILDEGIVTFPVENREGRIEMHKQSLRNTMIIATSNKGANVFQSLREFSQQENELIEFDIDKPPTDKQYEQLRQVNQTVRQDLLNGEGAWRPEMINRFQRMLMYDGLSKPALAKIADKQIKEVVERFKIHHNIEIVLNTPRIFMLGNRELYGTDVAVYIAESGTNADDTNSGGARAIKRAININIVDQISEEIIKHPETKRFRLEVTRDHRIYDKHADTHTGGVKVSAIK